MLKRPKFITKPLSTYHPKLLALAIFLKVINKKIDMLYVPTKEKLNAKFSVPLRYNY
jgi:hypothetical protein